MIRSNLIAALVALAVALVFTVRIEEHRLAAERGRGAALALQAVNVAAERDSTRNAALDNAKSPHCSETPFEWSSGRWFRWHSVAMRWTTRWVASVGHASQ